MIVSPASSPNPNHSGRSMICLANDGRADWKSGGCIEHRSDVLFGFSQVFQSCPGRGIFDLTRGCIITCI